RADRAAASSGRMLAQMPYACNLRQQVCCHAASEHAPARSERLRAPVSIDEAESVEAFERRGVEYPAEPLDVQRLVEPEAEHDLLTLLYVNRQRLELPGRSPARGQLGNVGRQAGRVPPAVAFDCRDRTDPEPEVVPAEPVREVVSRAQVAVALTTEVRRLVPAVAVARQRLDDELEVRLHRLGLARQLLPVGMGDARPRLCFETFRGG